MYRLSFLRRNLPSLRHLSTQFSPKFPNPLISSQSSKNFNLPSTSSSNFGNFIFRRHFSSSVSQKPEEPPVVLPHTPSRSKKRDRRQNLSQNSEISSSIKNENIDEKFDQSDDMEDDSNRTVQNLLQLVTDKLREKGIELILPDTYVEHLEQSPLGLLLREGRKLKLDFIADAFSLRPKFLEIPSTKWESILKAFKDAQVSIGIVLAALVGNPKVFEMDLRDLNSALIQLGQMGIKDRVLASVLAKRPQVLTSNIAKMEELIANMTSFFPRAKLAILIRRDPEFLFMDFDKLEAKYEYVFYTMGQEPMDLYRSRKWYRLSLGQMECRHQFLIRCGAWLMPNEKKPELAVDNPRLELVLDTDDTEFAKLAGVSSVEWATFQKIYDQEEPRESELADARFLRRTGRTAPKEEDDGAEWEDVSVEEIEAEDRAIKEERGEHAAKKKGGKKPRKHEKKSEKKPPIEDELIEEIDRDMEAQSKKRRDLDNDDDQSIRGGGRRRRDIDRDSSSTERVFARSLSQKEMMELDAHLRKISGGTSRIEEEMDEDDDESEEEDDEPEEIVGKQRQQPKSWQQKSSKRMADKDKAFFRKRGVFLSSED